MKGGGLVLIELLKKLGIDEKLSKYDFKEVVSNTGNSSAIKAFDKENAKNVFIKFLLFPRHDIEIKKFSNEIYISERLGRYSYLSCFPKYFEGGELIENYIYYFVTEWIDGITLQNKILSLKDFNEKDKLCLFYQIVRALTACSSFEHRDLHPGNIFIIEDQFQEFNNIGFYDNRISPGIKIVDFGEATFPMATQYDDSPDFLFDSFFQTGKKINTAFNYLAPESFLPILEGKFVRRLNETSDVWSLGIIFYLIFFDENLFSYPDIGSYLESMQNGSMQLHIDENSYKFLELSHPSKKIIYELFRNTMKVNYKERVKIGDIQIILWFVIQKQIVYSGMEIQALIKSPISFLEKKGLLEDHDYD